MGTVYRMKGRAIWMLKYAVRGRPRYESSKTTNKTEAEKLLKKREVAVDNGEVLPKRGHLTVDTALAAVERDYVINAFASLAVMQARIRLHLLPFFGRRYLSALTPDDIGAYIDARRAAGAKNSTINRELSILIRAFTLAHKTRAITYPLQIPTLEEHNVREGFFEVDELDAVCAFLKEPFRHVMRFAFYTGWRVRAEIIPLKWSQIDKDVIRLEPGTTKNKEGRTFPYTVLPPLAALIKTRRALRNGPYVFHDGAGQPLPKYYALRWRVACQKADLVGKIPHDFRRTAVRNLVRCGVPEKVAMMLTGHKSRAVFERYHIVNEQDLKQAVARLAVPAPLTFAERKEA